jgi:hypothetical protein
MGRNKPKNLGHNLGIIISSLNNRKLKVMAVVNIIDRRLK